MVRCALFVQIHTRLITTAVVFNSIIYVQSLSTAPTTTVTPVTTTTTTVDVRKLFIYLRYASNNRIPIQAFIACKTALVGNNVFCVVNLEHHIRYGINLTYNTRAVMQDWYN